MGVCAQSQPTIKKCPRRQFIIFLQWSVKNYIRLWSKHTLLHMSSDWHYSFNASKPNLSWFPPGCCVSSRPCRVNLNVIICQCLCYLDAWGAGMWPWPASTSCCAFCNNQATDGDTAFHKLGTLEFWHRWVARWGAAAWFDYESPQDILTIHRLLIKPTGECCVASGGGVVFWCVYEEQSAHF